MVTSAKRMAPSTESHPPPFYPVYPVHGGRGVGALLRLGGTGGGAGSSFRGGHLVGRRGRGSRHLRGALPGLRGTLLLLLLLWTLTEIDAAPMARVLVAGGEVVQVAHGVHFFAGEYLARVEHPDVVQLLCMLEVVALGALGCALVEPGHDGATGGRVCRVCVDQHVLRWVGARETSHRVLRKVVRAATVHLARDLTDLVIALFATGGWSQRHAPMGQQKQGCQTS
ncbi:hypothetical protein PG999_005330 [Apiospora kogelbergensis]|uniref:Secreted protein n=1 Tax=Apiospora kogelbergensis TaxID=1337665 RepID=A0AAW0R1R7_9PEZI